MESTGASGKIQVSEACAELLRARNKSHWLERRPDAVNAKGKGQLITYWCSPHNSSGGATGSVMDSSRRSTDGAAARRRIDESGRVVTISNSSGAEEQ